LAPSVGRTGGRGGPWRRLLDVTDAAAASGFHFSQSAQVDNAVGAPETSEPASIALPTFGVVGMLALRPSPSVKEDRCRALGGAGVVGAAPTAARPGLIRHFRKPLLMNRKLLTAQVVFSDAEIHPLVG
jgi:hypothetical protein